jgi:AcrR family transcriptional regulator
MTTTPTAIPPPQTKQYRGQSAAARVAERRRRLIETAVELYGKAGFRATPVKSICQATGLTERYFYESFANGEALLCITCSEIMADLRRQALAALEQTDGSLAERAHGVAYAYFEGIRQNPAAGRVILLEMEGVSAMVDAHYASEIRHTTDLVTQWFFSAPQPEASQPLQASVMAQGIVGALYQIAKEWIRADLVQSSEDMARHMQVLLLGVHSAYYSEPT